MKKIFPCCFFLFATLLVQAQNWNWAESAGGTLPDEANGCALDQSGNMYASGFYFSSSINFGHGVSITNDGINSDGFVVKYSNAGVAQWASKIKGSGEDKVTKCAVDNAGNVIATGYFKSASIQFGGNNSNKVLNSDASGNTFDAFIVKYDSNGTPLWFRAIGAADDDGGASVTTDADGNVYVTGWFRASSMVVGGVTVNNTDPSGGTSDMFIIKYASNGDVLWATNAGTLEDDKGRGCIVDPTGNVVVVGYCKGSSFMVDGTPYTTNGGKDTFVIRYGANGNVRNVKMFGGTGGEEGFACSVDGTGNVYVTGNYSSSSVAFDTQTITNTGTGSGIFLVKLDTAFAAVWAKGVSSNDSDEPRDCSTNSYGNTVVTGVFKGSSITFGNTVLNNNGGEEVFVVKYDTDGNLFWAKKIGKSKDDGGNGIAMNNEGKIAVCGYFNSSSLTLGSHDLSNSSSFVTTSDVFVGSMCSTSIAVDHQVACGSFEWIDGNTYTTSNPTASINYPAGASNSCDSMLVLDLTINTVDVSVTETPPTLTANAQAATYRWLNCEDDHAFLVGENGAGFTATGSGSYAVEVTQNGCIDTSACILVATVSVDATADPLEVKLFPNPATTHVVVQVNGTAGSVVIFDQLGRTVYSRSENSNRMTIDLQGLEAGIYFLQLRAGDHTVIKKLIVQGL